MERFVLRENVKHYRDMLERTTDGSERQRLQVLLDEELLKLKVLGDGGPKAKQA